MLAKHKRFLPVVLISVGACAAYLPTVMPDISANPNSYFTDVGNVQNALSLWGTLHSSGYPLFSLAGAVFVTVLRAIGVAPAAAASLFSTVWAIAALVVFYRLIVAWRHDRWVAIVVTGLLGVGWAYWLFASYAEVYSFSYFIVAVALYAAVRADQTGQARWLYVLAVCAGMSVAHHRAIALVAPALLLIAGPALWREVRRHPLFVVKGIGLALLCGAVPYTYLWLRAQQPGAWIWGNPTTLDGLWQLMSGGTYLRLIVWPTTLEGWQAIVQRVVDIQSGLQTWPIILLGAGGVARMLWRRQYRYGLAFLVGGLVPFVMAVADQTFYGLDYAPEDIPALLQMTTLFILLALAFLLSDFTRPALRRAGLAFAAAVGVWLVVQNQPMVYALTHDTTGRRIIADAQQFVADGQFATPPTFFSPWGGEFWALSYASRVTGELKNFQLLPNRANLTEALNKAGRLYVFAHTFYRWNLDWWRKRLHGQIYLSSAGNDMVAIAKQPVLSEPDLPGHNTSPIAMGDSSIVLRDWAVRSLGDGRWQISLYWQALARPDRDYSVYIHASDHPAITDPENIVAQDDAGAPVDGWYPTSRWSPGEIVRDDSMIAPPPDKPARIIEVGLYTRDDAGNFHNFGRQVIPLR